MTDPADLRFFRLLAALCDELPGPAPDARALFGQAAQTGDPLDMRAARRALDDLDAPLKDALLSRLHRRMVTDPSALRDAMFGSGPPGRPN